MLRDPVNRKTLEGRVDCVSVCKGKERGQKCQASFYIESGRKGLRQRCSLVDRGDNGPLSTVDVKRSEYARTVVAQVVQWCSTVLDVLELSWARWSLADRTRQLFTLRMLSGEGMLFIVCDQRRTVSPNSSCIPGIPGIVEALRLGVLETLIR
jgi:hypothetical protein